MAGTEVSVKRALQTAMKYSRGGHYWIKFILKKYLHKFCLVAVVCVGNADDKRNFLIWVDDLGLNTAEYIYIMPKTKGEGMTTKSNKKQTI